MLLSSLDSVLFCPALSLFFSCCGEIMMSLAALIDSSPMSLFIFTVLCVIGFIIGICMILYAVRETVFLVREVIQEKKE